MEDAKAQPPAAYDLDALLSSWQNEDERALAARYAPVIQFDIREPFLPLAAGYTIFRADANSPSFPRRIELTSAGQPPAALAIEYTIWWDWDIGHLYELEHAWVYIDNAGEIVRAEASWHGGCHDMAVDGTLSLAGQHVQIYSEPGKHAFAPVTDWLAERAPNTRRSCGRLAGAGGVWVTPLFEEELGDLRTPYANTLVRTHLQRHAFEPTWRFDQLFRITEDVLVPWPALQAWIPGRVAQWVDQLAAEIKPEELRFLRIAHRGASAYAPENTLAAFRRAAELGADMIELDVHVSADGVPVVIHDVVVDRLTEGRGAVGDLTVAQLKALDAGEGERIPTLDEALEFCKREGVGIYIELKAGAAVRPVVSAIQRHQLHEWAVISSFRPDWIAGVKLLDPGIATSVLFGTPNVDPVQLARAVGADFVHPCWESLVPEPHTLLTPEWISRVREAGLGIICWHEERPAEIAALRRMGVDGICSAMPDRLL